MPGFNRRQRLLCARRCRPCAMHCGTAIWSAWCRFASPPPIRRYLRHTNQHSRIDMARRSTVRCVEEFILFDALYEDETSWRSPPPSCGPDRPPIPVADRNGPPPSGIRSPGCRPRHSVRRGVGGMEKSEEQADASRGRGAERPARSAQGLWGGELPVFDSLDAVNELLAALIMGLWNRLSRHQERSTPFRLLRVDISRTREGLAGISLIRREELDGFLHGLFGKEESVDLPERARRALTALSEMRAMLEGVRVVAGDPTKPATFHDIAQALGNVRELTKIREREIHEAVLSCTRARRQTLRSMPT